MPKPISKKEQRWEYDCHLTFNDLRITKFTITDHWQENHSRAMNNELICEIVNKLDGEDLDPEPKENSEFRDVFVWEYTFSQGKYKDKKYRLIFWYDDYDPHGLWIRNCFRID